MRLDRPFPAGKRFACAWHTGPNDLPTDLQSPAQLTIWSAGGWWWTIHSPTGSGPEGSSPNELGTGHVPASHLSANRPAPAVVALTRPRGAGETPHADRSRPSSGQAEPDGMSEAGQTATGKGATPYRVLARKYRPSDFTSLIGQEPMVRTLTNAFSSGRIAQAWMLTGVRGVGKTTTARILARALNYETDTVDAPYGRPLDPRRALPGHHGRPPCRRDRDGRRLPHRHRRHSRDHRAGALCAGRGPLQGLHHRRGAHALARRPSTAC